MNFATHYLLISDNSTSEGGSLEPPRLFAIVKTEHLMSIFIWTIIVGFVVGLIARALVPGKDEAGFLVTTGLGISGALIGSVLGRILGMYGPQEPASLVMSVLGAVIVLLAYRRFFASTRPAAQ